MSIRCKLTLLVAIIAVFSIYSLNVYADSEQPELDEYYILEISASSVVLPQVKNINGLWSYKISMYEYSDSSHMTPIAQDLNYTFSFKKDGKYRLKYDLISGTQTMQLFTVIEVKDTVAPVLSISGLKNTYTAGEKAEFDIYAVDNIDGPVAYTIYLTSGGKDVSNLIKNNSIDTSTAGEYMLKIEASDIAGNNSEIFVEFEVEGVIPFNYMIFVWIGAGVLLLGGLPALLLILKKKGRKI